MIYEEGIIVSRFVFVSAKERGLRQNMHQQVGAPSNVIFCYGITYQWPRSSDG